MVVKESDFVGGHIPGEVIINIYDKKSGKTSEILQKIDYLLRNLTYKFSCLILVPSFKYSKPYIQLIRRDTTESLRIEDGNTVKDLKGFYPDYIFVDEYFELDFDAKESIIKLKQSFPETWIGCWGSTDYQIDLKTNMIAFFEEVNGGNPREGVIKRFKDMERDNTEDYRFFNKNLIAENIETKKIIRKRVMQ